MADNKHSRVYFKNKTTKQAKQNLCGSPVAKAQEILEDWLLFLPQNSHQTLCIQLWAHSKYGWDFSLWYKIPSLHKR